MGLLQATEMAEHLPREAALRWHLQSNHYPPVPVSLVPACERAIDLAVQEDWHDKVDLPDDVTYRGFSTAPAGAIVEQFHLEPFVDAAWAAIDEQEGR